ncbi:hypothetical protein [Subsaximicrobium wynnwilliamsii]|nr:hypothetical protein [Subsaximicrobium wynnwilliamsii]
MAIQTNNALILKAYQTLYSISSAIKSLTAQKQKQASDFSNYY